MQTFYIYIYIYEKIYVYIFEHLYPHGDMYMEVVV